MKKKLKGLEAWLPEDGAPHIYAYSNLLRNGYSKKIARAIIMKQLNKLKRI